MNKYLFLVAHVDDAEISCGGTIAKLIEQGHFIHVISFTERYAGESLYNEFEASMKTLGVEFYQTYDFKTRELHKSIVEIADLARYWSSEFDFVFTHTPTDRHIDHRTVAEQVIRVVNGSLLTFINPYNGDGDSNFFMEISKEHLEKKMQSIACYKSQEDRLYILPRFTNANAIWNGLKCGKLYAEGFRVHRLVQ